MNSTGRLRSPKTTVSHIERDSGIYAVIEDTDNRVLPRPEIKQTKFSAASDAKTAEH